MTSWLLLATADAVTGAASGAPEGGLFDLDATLPLMAVQVVLLTFILNALFFRPVGRAVEEREGYVTTSRAEAKQKLAQAQRLEADLTEQLKEARQEAQRLIVEAEQESDKLYREALATAQAEAIAVREKARREIESEKDQALVALKVEADRLGALIVDRLLAAK
jgi:F-type H+-transporting ATPase subunit b